MHNVDYKVEGDKLIITVNVGAEACNAAPPSKTGKTQLVGTTGAKQPIQSPKGWSIDFALNVMAKRQ
jgi:hypothetical protein